MTTPRQLRDTEIEPLRKSKSARQKYRCPICMGSIAFGINALDHSHVNGNVRSVLCTSCNVGEGKVLAGALFRTPKGNLAYTDTKQWLLNLVAYLDHHEKNPSNIIHPTFDLKTGKQKPIKRASTVKKPTKRKPSKVKTGFTRCPATLKPKAF